MPKEKKGTKEKYKMEIIPVETQKQAGTWLELAKEVAIIDQLSMMAADTFAKDIKRFRLSVEKEIKPHVETAFKAYKGIKGLMDKFCVPLKDAEQQIKNKMIEYNREMERIRVEAAEKAQREAEEVARKERERLEREALEAMDKGNEEEAELKAAQAEEVNAQDHIPVAQPGMVAPKGTTIKKNWQVEITDKDALIKAVLEEKAPSKFIIPDLKVIGQWAKAVGDTQKIPGIRVYDKGTVSIRTV